MTIEKQVSELENKLDEITKRKEEEESSKKSAEELIEKIKQESHLQVRSPDCCYDVRESGRLTSWWIYINVFTLNTSQQEELNRLLAEKTKSHEDTEEKRKVNGFVIRILWPFNE